MPQIIINNNGLDLEEIERMHKNQVECALQKNECIWMNY